MPAKAGHPVLHGARFAHRIPLALWNTGSPGQARLDRATTVASPSIIVPQIFREAVGLVEIVPIIEIAIQQGAGLALVIRRDVVSLRQAALKDIAIILIVRLRADEDADAVGRLGIEIADVAAIIVNHEAMRRQGAHRLLAGGIIGELYAKSGRGEQKAVLLEERLAR